MVPLSDFLLFGLASMLLTISPGPSMLYLMSRTLVQGRRAGIISLLGINCGSLFHICMMGFGLSIVLFTIPFVFGLLKIFGAAYLLYLAYNTVKRKNVSFNTDSNPIVHSASGLFKMGFFSNLLNPKTALFYISFLPQFIKPEEGSVALQSLALGAIQITISFIIYSMIVISMEKLRNLLNQNTIWQQVQKWFMASVLVGLAIKLAFTKAH